MQDDPQIQVIQDTDTSELPDSNTDTAADFFKEMVLSFAEIGRQLAETYSEENQETAAGFVESLRVLETFMDKVRNSEILTVSQKDGLLELIKYLQGKLHRRASAVDTNVMNM